jgi:hypothetical protein
MMNQEQCRSCDIPKSSAAGSCRCAVAVSVAIERQSAEKLTKKAMTHASDSVVKCHARTVEACNNLYIFLNVLRASLATPRKEKVPFARNASVSRLRSCVLEYLNGNSYSVVTTLLGDKVFG